MDDVISFASRDYFLMLLVLAFGRAMDIFSTWIATPNLVLEGNPIAKKLGWRWGIPLNIAICCGVAFWPVSAIAISTTSVLVAARNFQSAWLMRSLGEEFYRDWHVVRIQEASLPIYLLCLAGNSLLPAIVGVALIYLSGRNWIVAAIGLGVVVYGIAVALYTLLAVWRIRRPARKPRLTIVPAPISPKMESDPSLN